MNRDAAVDQLGEYLKLVNRARELPVLTKDRRAALKAANEHLPTVNYILSNLAPDIPLIGATSVADHAAALPRLQRAVGLLSGWGEMAVHQWPGGGPAFPLKLLDPVISEVALPLWEANKFRQAVNDAATNLNLFAQRRLGRYDISDKDLMGQAFSDKEPDKGKARLRCPGSLASETVRSQQEGARAFAIGTFQAIRNPAHHLSGGWNPVDAFHHLAALSQVAHYFRHWNIKRYVPPPPDFKELNAALAKIALANGEDS